MVICHLFAVGSGRRLSIKKQVMPLPIWLMCGLQESHDVYGPRQCTGHTASAHKTLGIIMMHFLNLFYHSGLLFLFHYYEPNYYDYLYPNGLFSPLYHSLGLQSEKSVGRWKGIALLLAFIRVVRQLWCGMVFSEGSCVRDSVLRSVGAGCEHLGKMGRKLEREQLVGAWSFLPQAFLARLYSNHRLQELFLGTLSTMPASLIFMSLLTYFILILSSYPAWVYFIDLFLYYYYYYFSFSLLHSELIETNFLKILKVYVDIFTYFVRVGMHV